MAKKPIKKTTTKKPATATPKPKTPKQLLSKREKDWLLWNGGHYGYQKWEYDDTVRLYLKAMHRLDEICVQRGETVERLMAKVTREARVKNHYRDRPYYHLYYTLKRMAFNIVREKHYLHLIQEDYTHAKKYKDVLQQMLIQPFAELLREYAHTVPPMDEKLDMKYNRQDSYRRWSKLYESIRIETDEHNWQQQYEKVCSWPLPAKKKLGGDGILYAAAHLFSNFDGTASVSLYLRYLHAKYENKEKLPYKERVYKKLFKTQRQIDTFETIVKDLRATDDLNAALAEAPYIFKRKYEKIELDTAAIETVTAVHSATVGTLSKILSDKEEPEPAAAKNEAKTRLKGSKAVADGRVKRTEEKSAAGRAAAGAPVTLGNTELGLLTLFSRNGFRLKESAVVKYAKEQGRLKGQLIESINQQCSSMLNDILIEESDEGYEILEKYYRKILPA